MYQTSADLIGWFRPKRKSRKTFDNLYTKSDSLKSPFEGGGGGLQPDEPPSPSPLCCAS